MLFKHMSFTIPRELQGNNGKIKEYCRSMEEYVAAHEGCFAAIFNDVLTITNTTVTARYQILEIE